MKQYQKIIKQIGLVYVIQVFNFLLSFFLFIVITRSLTQYEFGIYSLLNVTIIFLTAFLGLGLDKFIIRNLAGLKEHVKKERFSKIFTFVLFFTLISTVILVVGGWFLLSYLKYKAIFPPLVMVILCSLAIVLGDIIAYYAYAKKQVAKTTLIGLMLMSMWALPLIILSFFFTLNINLIFMTKLIFTIAVFAYTVFYFRKEKLRFFNKVDNEYIKKALVFSLPLLTLIVSQWVITASDRYMLGLFHSAIIVGKYSYIYSFLNFILVFSTSAIVMTIYPSIVESYNKGFKQKSNFLLNASLKYILILILPAITGFLFLNKEIITMISGDKYISAAPLVPFLLVFPLLEGLNVVSRKILILKNKTKEIAAIYIKGILLNIILNLILIPKYHYFGAAIATSISYIFLFVLFYTKTKKHLKLDHYYLKLPRIILSTIIMALAIAFIHPQNVFTKLATIGFGALVYLLSLYITKAYIKKELELIKSFFLRKKQIV